MRRFFLSLLVFALTLPAAAQAKHPFTFDDMMKLKRVGDPQVSPDGKWVIFSVVDVDLEANTKTPHIWIVPLGGNRKSRFLHSAGCFAFGESSRSGRNDREKKWGYEKSGSAPCLAEFARLGNHGTHSHPGPGRRPPALGAGREAVCVSVDEGRWIAGLDCRFRWRSRTVR